MSWIFYVTHTSTFLQRRRARSSSSHFGAFLNERSLFSLLLSTHPFCRPASSTRLHRGSNRAISAPCTATPRALPLLQCLKLLPSSPPSVTMPLNPPSCLNQRTAKLKTHRRSSAARWSRAENTVSESSHYRPLTDIISLTCLILSGAIFISTHSDRGILKVPWSKPYIQLGRGPYTLGNDVILPEKRVSNTHCRFTLGMQGTKNLELANDITKAWKEGEGEPEVWVEDLKSSNGTFVG